MVSSNSRSKSVRDNDRAFFDAYQKGKTTQAYYNPEKPSEAVLIPGASVKSILLFMVMDKKINL